MITTMTYDKCYAFCGLSTDTKPTEGVGNGSTFFEMDSKKRFMFDEENQEWLDISE